MALSPTSHEGQFRTPVDFALMISNVTSPSTLYENNATVLEGCLVLAATSKGFIPWDNPDNIINQETEQAVDTAVGAICLPILLLISVPGNILNMLVFWKQGLKERINLCLFYLSLVDFLHMLNSFFVNVDRLQPPITHAVGPVFEFIVAHKLVGFRGFTWLSGFVSMLIACERCLCVVSPLRSQTVLKTRTTAVILMVATVLILTGSLLIGLRWDLICVFDPATNRTSKVIYTSKFYAENKAHLDILTFFIGIPQLFTYIIVVSAATVATLVKLRKMAAWREQTSTSTLSTREVALTRTLVAISILYIICSVPSVVSAIGVMFVPGIGLSGRYYNFTNLLISSIEFASFINATFNFFVYIVLGSKYKEILFKIVRCEALAVVSAANQEAKELK